MQWTNIYDFHAIALVIPFFLFAFYFALVKNWKWFWIFLFLMLITKEEVGFIVGFLGLFISVIQKK